MKRIFKNLIFTGVCILLFMPSLYAQSTAPEMVIIPGTNYMLSKTEITQSLYEEITGKNKSEFKGSNLPVENVSLYDAIYFCNLLSIKQGKQPVYKYNGETDVTTWDYIPNISRELYGGDITEDQNANGYRLPTAAEWEYAANGGQDYQYSGSDNVDEVAWYYNNANYETHPVAQKKPNGYGLYDMSGNVWEWTLNHSNQGGLIFGAVYIKGGSWYDEAQFQKTTTQIDDDAAKRWYDTGFRVLLPIE